MTTKNNQKGTSHVTPNSVTNNPATPLGLTKETKKDLTRANLVGFLNKFNVKTVWTKRHEKRFENVLNGELVSPQLCELYSLGIFLSKHKIELIEPNKKVYNFKPVVAMADILSDYTKSLKEKNGFTKSNVKDFKKFVGVYSLVLLSVAKGVERYDSNTRGIAEEEGKQILSFMSLLTELGYSYK